MATPEKLPNQNRSSSSNAKKDKPNSIALINTEAESVNQLNNDTNSTLSSKIRGRQIKSQTTIATSDKNLSSTGLPSFSSTKANLAPNNKTTHPQSSQDVDKLFNQQSTNTNDKIIFSEKKNNSSKQTNEFRQGSKPKTTLINNNNSNTTSKEPHRPSLKGPQSIELFQKEHLPGLLSPNKSKFVIQQSNSPIDKKENDRNGNNNEENIIDFNYYKDQGEEEEEDEGMGIGIKKTIVRPCLGMSQAGKHENDVAKENQDSFFVLNNVLGLEDYHIYGVMDGHGANGHFVSRYIKQNAEDYFTKEDTYRNTKKAKQSLTSAVIYTKLTANDNSIIKTFFKKTTDGLINEKFDVHYSGSTCVIVFQLGTKLLCANVGDSRAIAIKDNRSTVEYPSSDPFAYFEVVPLSNDHKPEYPEEKERIEKMGGKVEQSIEKDGSQNGPYRVFVKGEKYPGIAMSRSLGDEIAESIGVVHTPEIIVKELTNHYKYLILASDGVWEFLSNEKVMSIINLHFFRNDVKSACEAVIAEATAWWKKEDETIDDITVVIAFLGAIHIKKCTV